MSLSSKLGVDSEYHPSNEDLARAQHAIYEGENQVQKICEELQSLDKIMSTEGPLNIRSSVAIFRAQTENLERLRAQISVDINLHRSILAPIRKAPPEILGEIFFHILAPWNPLDGSRPWSGFDYAPWLLTRICRRWRRIAFGTPKLWTTVHMAFPMNLPLIIPSWVKYSGSLPFDVFLEFPSLLSSQVQHPKFALVLQGIWGEFHRCRTLSVELCPSDYSRFDAFLNSWRQCQMPALTTLIVHSDHLLRIGQLYAPNLRNLVIQTKQWHSIYLEPIRHALPLSRPFLTSLYLEKISTSVEDMVGFIEASLDLVDCTVKFENLTPLSRNLPLIPLIHLKSLSLDWPESDQAITSLLCALHIPALTSLSLHGRKPLGSLIEFDHLLRYGSWGDMSALTHLTLRKLHISGDAFVQIMRLHIHMAEVDLVGCDGLNELAESLVPGVGRSSLFPRLRKLSLSLDGDVVFETLIDAIRPRVGTSSRDGGGDGYADGRLDEFVLLSRTEISAEHQKALRDCLPYFTHVTPHVVTFRTGVKFKTYSSVDLGTGL